MDGKGQVQAWAEREAGLQCSQGVSGNSMGTLSLGCFFRDAFIVENGLSFVLLHGPIVDTDLPQEGGSNG